MRCGFYNTEVNCPVFYLITISTLHISFILHDGHLICLFFYKTVLDKNHHWPNGKINFVIPQMTTNKPSKIPISQPHCKQITRISVTPPTSNMSSLDTVNQHSDVSVADTVTLTDRHGSNKRTDAIEVQHAEHDLSSSLRTSGGKSADSGFEDVKNRQQTDVYQTNQFVPFSDSVEHSDHTDTTKLFVPLEEDSEVDQGLIRTTSQGSLASTAASTSSLSLGEMVGDERSSSGHDYIRMSLEKTSESEERSVSAQFYRPHSATAHNQDHQRLMDDQQLKRHGSLPTLESPPTLLASKISLLYSEKVRL